MSAEAEQVVERLFAELEEVAAGIEECKASLDRLYDERLVLFKKLTALPGITHKMIADHSRVTNDMVAFALFTDKKKQKALTKK